MNILRMSLSILKKLQSNLLKTGCLLLFISFGLVGTAHSQNQSFTLVLLPDTENYITQFPDTFYAQTRWIAKNAKAQNIKYVLHLGDLVKNNTEFEWDVARNAFQFLEGKVPYALATGSRDMTMDPQISRDSLFSKYFPVAEFKAWPTFGGVYDKSPDDARNIYHLFEAAGRKWMILVLEYAPRDDAVRWANEVVSQHSDHSVIVLTHTYLNSLGKHYTSSNSPYQPLGGDNNGKQLWDKLVSQHANIVLVLSGEHGPPAQRLTSTGTKGNQVQQLMMSYQSLPRGGQGWMRMMHFLEDGKTVEIQDYSPTQDTLNPRPDSQFVMKLFHANDPPQPNAFLSVFQQQAEQGDPNAQYRMGEFYELGYEIEQDIEKAVEWYEKAVQQGHAQARDAWIGALLNLGYIYEVGYGRPQDLEASAKWYSQASAQGHPEAQKMFLRIAVSLGSLYENGYQSERYINQGVEVDYKKSVQWYREAAEWGDIRAMKQIAALYTRKDGSIFDLQEAAKWYQKAADIGDLQAQVQMGHFHLMGYGVQKDPEQAAKIYQAAANRGSTVAQSNLALMYYEGHGIRKDLAKAIEWYRKAADQGDTKAQTNLGSIYENGEGTDQDYEEAVKWYRKAALGGEPNAQTNLGNMYLLGHGVKQDYQRALRWYREAANQGHPKAQFNMGNLYRFGSGVAPDMEIALKWYQRAAQQGHARAKVSYNEVQNILKDQSADSYFQKARQAGE